jgi:hypothetical protein
MVGDKKWQETVTKLGSLLVNSKVRYFEEAELHEAQKWLRE